MHHNVSAKVDNLIRDFSQNLERKSAQIAELKAQNAILHRQVELLEKKCGVMSKELKITAKAEPVHAFLATGDGITNAIGELSELNQLRQMVRDLSVENLSLKSEIQHYDKVIDGDDWVKPEAGDVSAL